MIQINGVTKHFPTVTALQHVSLTVNDGEFFGFLGPNGAGKSTLMSLLVGYLDADEGEILIGGKRVTRNTPDTRRNIGLVPQALALYDDISAQENLDIFGSFYQIPKSILAERIKQQLHAVQLYERRKDKVKTFSGGIKRRLNLVASLLHDPILLLCDEPTVGVDPQSRNAIFDYLTTLIKQGKTIVYTTHYMEEAERLCDRIAIIDAGAIIAEGTVDGLLEKLLYEECISITKNRKTIDAVPVFQQCGILVDKQENFELKLHRDFQLSRFIALTEQHGIDYRFITIRKPTLEAVFLQLTGRSLRD